MTWKKLVVRDVKLDGAEIVITVNYYGGTYHEFKVRCPLGSTVDEMKAEILVRYAEEMEVIELRGFIGYVIDV